MPVSYFVTPEVLSKFKEPFGILIEGSYSETTCQLKKLIAKENPSMIITVGDRVSRNLHERHVNPQLSITDNQSMRKKLRAKTFPEKEIVQVKNPKGYITEEAIRAVQDGLKSGKRIQILVDGEEDLLTLIAVLYAPENAFVVYGQPQMGIVVVKVTSEKRIEAQRIWKAMKPV